MLHNRGARLKFPGFRPIDKAFPGPPPGAAKQDIATEFPGAEVKVPESAGRLSRIVMTLS